jgi:sarcosine oxidase subunit beta
MAWDNPAETPGFKVNVDRGFVEKILALAADRVPVFAEAEVNPSRVWAGLYEVTPDHHPILGPCPVYPGCSSPTDSADMESCTLRRRGGFLRT